MFLSPYFSFNRPTATCCVANDTLPWEMESCDVFARVRRTNIKLDTKEKQKHYSFHWTHAAYFSHTQHTCWIYRLLSVAAHCRCGANSSANKYTSFFWHEKIIHLCVIRSSKQLPTHPSKRTSDMEVNMKVRPIQMSLQASTCIHRSHKIVYWDRFPLKVSNIWANCYWNLQRIDTQEAHISIDT